MRSAPIVRESASPFSSAVLIQDLNMDPEIRRGSVAFIHDVPGFRCDGLYATERDGRFAGVYRAQSIAGGGVRMWMDNFPTDQDVSVETFKRINARLVVGVARPYTAEFEAFLRDRFVGAGP